MKSKRKLVFITAGLLLLCCGLAFYQPIRNDQIYQRDLKLLNESKDDMNTFDEDKLIKRAIDSLAEYVGVDIDENDYTINLNIASLNTGYPALLQSDIASITFLDKEKENTQYYIGYDTSSGKIMEIFAPSPASSSSDSVMSETELTALAKSYFTKINDVEEHDIKIETSLQDNFFRASILLQSDYHRYEMLINSNNGKVLYYYLMQN